MRRTASVSGETLERPVGNEQLLSRKPIPCTLRCVGCSLRPLRRRGWWKQPKGGVMGTTSRNNGSRFKRLGTLALAAAVLIALAVGASASIPGPDGVIHACYRA